MARFALTVAYEGTDFHGWQRQEPPGQEPLRTVQGVMDRVVSRVVGEPVLVVGASRTDAGVHALGQVAAFSSTTPIPVEKLPLAVTARLPADVQVRSARLVADDFDPISMAIRKRYRYTIEHHPPPEHWPPLFDRRTVCSSMYRLDAERMKLAARHFTGTHDFTSVAHMVHLKESPVRTISSCEVCAEGPHRLRVDIEGNGFLYNMVRIIAGTLIEVGRGRIEPDEIPEILASRDRTRAGDTAPPEGLCLMSIDY